MSIENLIDSLAAGNKAAAEDAFTSEMSDRMQDALDAKRVEIGKSIYGEPQAEEE